MRLKEELRNQEEENKLLQTKLAATEKRFETLQGERASADLNDLQEEDAKDGAILQADSALSEEQLRRANQNASLSLAKQRAVESLKGSIQTDINRVQGMVASRDKLVAEYKKNAKVGVSFSATKVVSSEDESIDELRSKLEKTSSARELSRIQSEIKGIQKKIESDIALIGRLKRLS